MTLLSCIKIVLVEPAGALNVGSIARVMKNMGLKQLILVNPHCDPLSDSAQYMAVHGKEILEEAQIVATLPEALTGCHRVIATTARLRSLYTDLETPKNALPWLLSETLSTALIFGPEDRGLSNEELNYAQRFICIPANPDYPSLNLAQAVAICVYELYQASLTPPSPREETESPASFEQRESYYQHLEETLLNIGYLYPHTAKARMEKFRRIFNRIPLTEAEISMLRGIFGQLNWMWEQKKMKNRED